MSQILNSLLPVFLLIGLGKALCQTTLFPGDASRNLNRLTYWIALPALLLDRITSAQFDTGQVVRLSALLIAATIGSALVGALAAAGLKTGRRSAGAFIQGSARSNNAFVGLPVILYSLGHHGPDVEALATISLAPSIVFYNIFSVSVLQACSGTRQPTRMKTLSLYSRQMLSNPLLLACAIGLVLNLSGFRFPVAMQRSLSTLGDAALALALLSLGSSLSFRGLGSGLAISSLAAGIKVFIQPLIGLVLALAWNLPPVERQMLLIFLACPTAVVSYVMADLFNSDRDLAAHIIVVSTLLSAVSLTIILAFGS